MLEVRRLGADEVRRHLDELAGVLVDCVEGGASVSFMLPFTQAEGRAFFEALIPAVEAGDRVLLAAFLDGRAVGTVQVILKQPPNQPHRADISKLLVHRRARGQGVAARLMTDVETAARQAGKSLLVLDTATGESAERLYSRLGWQRVGVIPRYALFPDGRPCDTTLFWKSL